MSLEFSILSTLEYFSLFKYSLLPEEIYRFLSLSCSRKDVDFQLVEMLSRKTVFISKEGFYSNINNPDWSIERKKGNSRAENLLKRSHRFVKVISSFPFVLSIAISGSLSKYYADMDADIDYFIITKKNRLWITRTLLHFYKKLTFISGHEHYYCMNYFVDETDLEIDQKNIYSAIETVTLLPVYNKELLLKLKVENSWIKKYLPNENFEQDCRFVLGTKNEPIKNFIERIINLVGANKLNVYLMNLTDRKWRSKWKKKSYPMDRYDEAFYTTLQISKNHPANYQAHVLKALDEKSELSTQPLCDL